MLAVPMNSKKRINFDSIDRRDLKKLHNMGLKGLEYLVEQTDEEFKSRFSRKFPIRGAFIYFDSNSIHDDTFCDINFDGDYENIEEVIDEIEEVSRLKRLNEIAKISSGIIRLENKILELKTKRNNLRSEINPGFSDDMLVKKYPPAERKGEKK